MNSQEAYTAVYQVIRQYQAETGNDDIAKMLLDIEPWPYTDEKGVERFGSADPAAFEDEWTDAWNAVIGLGQTGTGTQVVVVANRLLKYYSDNLGYNFEGLAVALRHNLKNGSISEVMSRSLIAL
ncbi:MAG: hypothetical protein LBC29_03015 [Propionibacteriaceae bacterium]|jgi:hypothetical protein|nr:hypothetical protein [Propionibacteriaceae bacterium]